MTVALLAILFAVSNRDAVSITLWPLPFAVDVGLYVIVLAAVLAGFLVGALATWMAAGKHRRRVRRQRSEIRGLESELDDVRNRLDESTKASLDKAA